MNLNTYPFIHNLKAILASWTLLAIGDYLLTIRTKNRLNSTLGDHIIITGSFEVNPFLQNDIDSDRFISFRHLFGWLLGGLILALAWWKSNSNNYRTLYVVFGSFILPYGAVYLRHLRKIALYRSYEDGAVIGKQGYQEWYSFKLSSWELFGFGLFFLILHVIEGSILFFGASVVSFVDSLYHFYRFKKSYKKITISRNDT
jgi:hypothetical protein